MNIRSQKGGIKSPGIYFIFYSSEDHNFNKIFRKDEKKPFKKFYTRKSLDNILTFFFKGFYMKNNESKIYMNLLNDTLIGRIIKFFISDNHIIQEVLNKTDINSILNNILNELINKKNKLIEINKEKISQNQKEELKLQEELESKINKLITDNNKKYNTKISNKENLKIIKKEKEITRDKIINFIKKIIYIYNKKISNNNKKMKILLDYDPINQNKSIILEDSEIVDSNILKDFIYKKNDPTIIIELNKTSIKIINSLREKYKIDSYMIVNIMPISTLGTSNKIIYNKKFNNNELNLFNNELYNQTYEDLSNRVVLKHHLGEHTIKYSAPYIFFTLVIAKFLIMNSIYSNPSGNPSSSSSFFLPHPSDISIFYGQRYLQKSYPEKKSTCSCVYKK